MFDLLSSSFVAKDGLFGLGEGLIEIFLEKRSSLLEKPPVLSYIDGYVCGSLFLFCF